MDGYKGTIRNIYKYVLNNLGLLIAEELLPLQDPEVMEGRSSYQNTKESKTCSEIALKGAVTFCPGTQRSRATCQGESQSNNSLSSLLPFSLLLGYPIQN